MKYDVFISYSRLDYKDEKGNVIPDNVVSKVKDALTSAGVTYWFDEDGIHHGDDFAEKIVANIEESDIFIYLSTENANKLKMKNDLNNLTNINGDCAKVIPDLAKQLEGDCAVVVDPPRKGVDKKVVEAFLESEPIKIVYLSCDPATLARDLGLLKEKYTIDFVQPYDMFPQTANVETLVCLIKK